MRKRLFPTMIVSLAATGLAWADSLPVLKWEPAAVRCANEISLMHGVWRSRQAFLPVYGDLELVVYLASLGARQAGVAVLPVFSPEAFYFRSNAIVFLSTGFILKAGSERELTEAIRRARVEVRTQELPGCAAMTPWAPASFADVRRRLAGQVAGYEDVTVRRLRRRDTGGQ
jgi:hypothetical protein